MCREKEPRPKPGPQALPLSSRQSGLLREEKQAGHRERRPIDKCSFRASLRKGLRVICKTCAMQGATHIPSELRAISGGDAKSPPSTACHATSRRRDWDGYSRASSLLSLHEGTILLKSSLLAAQSIPAL
jgi:hypothetical protein